MIPDPNYQKEPEPFVVNFVSFLWSDPNAKHKSNFDYGPKHVNLLHKTLKEADTSFFKDTRGLKIKTTIITDHPVASDFTFADSYVPLWKDFRDIGRCFTRLKLFSKYYDDLELIPMKSVVDGDCVVMIDIDTVILNPTAFVRKIVNSTHFNDGYDFIGYRDTKNPRCYSGALWVKNNTAYTNDKLHPVYDTFRHIYESFGSNDEARKNFFKNWNFASSFVGSDQSWISTVLGEDNYLKLSDWHGIYDFWQIEHLPKLPKNTSVVFMNGMRRDASMKEFQDKYPWVKEYWEQLT